MSIYDRKDGKILKDIDGMHFITPIIYPNRCDNEAFFSETIDLTNVDKYLKLKNKNNPEYKYNVFQVLVTTMLKTITLREKMNYFIANSNLYERNNISASFIVKKKFSDNAGEGLAFINAQKNDNIDTIHEKMRKIIYEQKSGKSDSTSDMMDIFKKMPRFISKFLVHIVMFLDKHGWVPNFLIKDDPYYSSVILTNLGSIKLHSGYHHLTNWGTTSIFVIVGEIKKREFINEDGKKVMHNSVDLGLTIDERIADGYYFSRTIALIKKILENPILLDEALSSEVEF